MRRSAFMFLLIAFSSVGYAQNLYKIEFKIKGWKDTTAYLGNYYGESTHLRDTAQVKGGQFVFDGKKPLAQGVYFLVLNKTKLFDFVVGKNTFFALETNADDYIKNMVVKNDEDNKLYFDNLLFLGDRRQEAEPFIKILQDSLFKDEQKKAAREEFSKINDKVMAYQSAVIEKHPTSLTARLLKATKQIDVPAPPKKADGSIDSTFQLKYYRQHFFDNFDLADDALIRMPSPFYQEKVKNTIMDNSNFFRVNYSNELFVLNGIFIKFHLNLQTIEKSFNKFKCLFDIKPHNDIILKFSEIEKLMMEKHNVAHKTPIYRISEQLNNGFLKIFNEMDCKDTNDFILKIYGIWETDCEYGLTYKFINI